MEKRKWYYGMPAKTGIFLALVISVLLTGCCILGCMVLWEGNFYTEEKEQMLQEVLYSRAHEESYRIFYTVIENEKKNIEENLSYLENTNCSYKVTDQDGKVVSGNYDGAATQYVFEFNGESEQYAESVYGEQPEPLYVSQPYAEYTLYMYIDDSFPKEDKYALCWRIINFAYRMRYWIYPITVVLLILSVIFFVFLMCSAGHRAGKEEITEGFMARIPFDVYSVAVGWAVLGAAALTFRILDYGSSAEIAALLIVLCILVLPAAIGYCMNVAVRVKLGTLWRNTLCFFLLRLCLRICRGMWRGCCSFFGALPGLWKLVLAVCTLFLAEFLVLFGFYFDRSDLAMLFLVEKIVLLVLAVWIGCSMRLLQKGAKALAEGDLSYKLDVKGMKWEFKAHAEYLNSIGQGMTAAVNERMKSERMKTELITNVSHDIKTPLTSIINYTDLIGKEKSENEKINEYAAVLVRQSARLKKLIEDLVEASKASTGNLEVSLMPMEVGVMLVQTTGEYTERLKEKDLTLITKQPEEPVKIMADGRHLWRVLDNLMNNVCKYAQEGTRVYLTVEKKKSQVTITLKNTSKYPLDIPAEELMERFVRGDESRSTEGNGLGLSIAQSLTELQKGKLELMVDGDLFKVTLRFPAMEEI